MVWLTVVLNPPTGKQINSLVLSVGIGNPFYNINIDKQPTQFQKTADHLWLVSVVATLKCRF